MTVTTTKKLLIILLACVSCSVFAKGKVIMEMDGVTLTDEEFYAAFKDQAPEYQEAMIAKSNIMDKFIRRLFVSRMVATKGEAALTKDKNTAMALQFAKEHVVHKMIIKKKLIEKINEVDFETLADNEYAANKDKYKDAFPVDFYHILLLKDNIVSHADTKKKADDILADLRAGKAKVADLAKQYKMPLAGVNDEGLVKGANPKALMPEIQKALTKMKVGDVSDLIESKIGYHIISLTKSHQPDTLGLNKQVKAQIIRSIERKLQDNVIKSINLPYENVDDYKINKAALDAVIKKIGTED